VERSAVFLFLMQTPKPISFCCLRRTKQAAEKLLESPGVFRKLFSRVLRHSTNSKTSDAATCVATPEVLFRAW
jgi:hypothetical protein